MQDPDHPQWDGRAMSRDNTHGLIPEPASEPVAWRAMLLDLDRSCYVFRLGDRIAMTTDPDELKGPANKRRAELMAVVPPLRAQQLGDPAFRVQHRLEFAYAAGAMANG